MNLVDRVKHSLPHNELKENVNQYQSRALREKRTQQIQDKVSKQDTQAGLLTATLGGVGAILPTLIDENTILSTTIAGLTGITIGAAGSWKRYQNEMSEVREQIQNDQDFLELYDDWQNHLNSKDRPWEDEKLRTLAEAPRNALLIDYAVNQVDKANFGKSREAIEKTGKSWNDISTNLIRKELKQLSAEKQVEAYNGSLRTFFNDTLTTQAAKETARDGNTQAAIGMLNDYYQENAHYQLQKIAQDMIQDRKEEQARSLIEPAFETLKNTPEETRLSQEEKRLTWKVGNTYRMLGDLEKAIDAYELGGNTDAINQIGHAYLEKGDLERADKVFKKANNTEGRKQLMLEYKNKGLQEKALEIHADLNSQPSKIDS